MSGIDIESIVSIEPRSKTIQQRIKSSPVHYCWVILISGYIGMIIPNGLIFSWYDN